MKISTLSRARRLVQVLAILERLPLSGVLVTIDAIAANSIVAEAITMAAAGRIDEKRRSWNYGRRWRAQDGNGDGGGAALCCQA